MEINKVLKLDAKFRGQNGQIRFDPLWERTSDDTNTPQGRFVVHFVPESAKNDPINFIKEENGVVRIRKRFDGTSEEDWRNLAQSADMMLDYNLHQGD